MRPTLPANAIGYLACRVDRPERFALHAPSGQVSNSFAVDEGVPEIRAILAPLGLEVAHDETAPGVYPVSRKV